MISLISIFPQSKTSTSHPFETKSLVHFFPTIKQLTFLNGLANNYLIHVWGLLFHLHCIKSQWQPLDHAESIGVIAYESNETQSNIDSWIGNFCHCLCTNCCTTAKRVLLSLFIFSVLPPCIWQPLQWHTANTPLQHRQTSSKHILATHYHSQPCKYIVSVSVWFQLLWERMHQQNRALMPQNATHSFDVAIWLFQAITPHVSMPETIKECIKV